MTVTSVAILIVLTVLFLVLAKQGRRTWLSFSFLGLMAVLGLYGYDLSRIPADVRWFFITPEGYEMVLILSLAFVVLFGLGEWIGYTAGYRNPVPVNTVTHRQSWVQLAIVLFFIGLAGQVIFVQSSGGFGAFYGSAHGSGANFSSAYIYRLFHSSFTAAVILLIFYLRGATLSRKAKAVLVLALIALAFDLVTQGKRGGVIRFALLVAVPLIGLEALTPKRLVLLFGGVLAALAFLVVLPYIRFALNLSNIAELGTAFSELSAKMNNYTDGDTLRTGGKYAVFATLVVQGALEATDHNFGSRWLFPFINLIPRAIWPDKPLRYDFGIDFYDVTNSTSNVLIPKGSYPGGIPESFTEWSWAVLVVWFIMGLVFGWVRGHAVAKKTMMALVVYYAVSVSFVQFMLQDTIQAIFSFIFLVGPFLVLVGIFKLLPRRKADGAAR
ncbi:hypothetical protein BMI91_05710 [Thioclava sediminum]|uniref:Oligosaccharide repeat unit polymerase n=1 Tax=Thioclava sediminum TaxID=1915319 RepID=A0ABX3N205_9RHOB|nr:hypothetical protein [Thioclava sediminum]OOY25883.1 hypothetical protein BMI91_05710 [Thioclava sediminum]